jgi:HTH-type transcriptional regulator/antitoxin HigA
MPNKGAAEVFHPGEFLRDELEERGWSQVEFADILGRSANLVSDIITGKRGITPETAKDLGAALGTSAELWMNLDAVYQLRKAREAPEAITRKAQLSTRYPVRDMVLRKWIEGSEDVAVLESRVLRFFEIKSLDDKPRLAFAAKHSGDNQDLSPIQIAWLYRVKHIASAMQVGRYTERALRDALPKLAALREAPEEIRNVPRILAECGVRFVIVEPFPSSKIDGVCFWLNARSPVIGMSLRFDRIDNFWFVLRHEIEHALNADGKESAIIIDSDLHLPNGQEDLSLPVQERQANAAAADFCVPTDRLKDFMTRVGPLYSWKRVLGFAALLHVHPGLVVGQLQRRIGRYDLFRKELVPVREIIIPVAMTDGYGHVCPV